MKGMQGEKRNYSSFFVQGWKKSKLCGRLEIMNLQKSFMKGMMQWVLSARRRRWTIILLCGLMLASCSDDSDNGNADQPVVLNCVKPDYLREGDKVALISPPSACSWQGRPSRFSP